VRALYQGMTSVMPEAWYKGGLEPLYMARPSRNSSPAAIELQSRTFFVTSKTIEGKALLQSDRMAALFIDVLRSYVLAKKFRVHDFVVMPNHFHLLITIDGEMSIEKALQLIKGNFSYRAKKELGFQREIWQKGFSEVRILDRRNFLSHRSYIESNPVKAGLADLPEQYLYGSAFLRKQKAHSG
jgi:REP-associated tyrosine transposase